MDVPAHELPCTRCRAPARGRVDCPECAAAHCGACAALPGRCARAGCPGELPAGPLPPLGILARSAAAWGDAVSPGAVVVLLPGPRAARGRTEAAQAVGELLGAGPDEGQRRLAAGHPEPILRCAEEEAEAAVARLIAAGLRACALPAAEVGRATLAFEVAGLVPGDPWRFKDAAGGELRALSAKEPRLVVAADMIEARRLAGRAATERRLVEAIGVVTTASDPRPLLIRARSMRGVPGLPAAAPLARRLAMVLAQLAAPPGVGVMLEGSRAPALLAPRPPEGDEECRDNVRSLVLAARILDGAWRAGKLPKDIPAIRDDTW